MEKEIELSELWRIVKQRLKMIFFLMVLFVTATGSLCFFVLPQKYEATATILVQVTESDQNSFNNVMANQKLVKTYGDIIKSRQVADAVIQNLGLNMKTEELLDRVEVSAPSESLVTSITVTDESPSMAAKIANGFAATFHQKIQMIMKVDNVSILDRAKVGPSPEPVFPKPYLFMGAAAVIGMMVGIALAFLFDYMDKSVKTEEQVEQILGVPVLGAIADFEKMKINPGSLRVDKRGRRSAREVRGSVS
ncbi:capsular polysaccharide biosynthesis protein [Melghirimyces profundicolus]|uniref:Capsular polysaccharide biosynthesis protein n=1 Tax=Melghirimyces profundicolus TaxID=1242148 RepID=A0A2T6BCC4_9BACL|nr:Wzz/FepE/Etk N-terminal domain-containing protein [Melghirimyces profundicolus]PTX53725.1 capsular polysaccharide biosynthesis protein [Melghirimyces profundicolus]